MKSILLCLVIVVAAVFLSGAVSQAQTFTNYHSFGYATNGIPHTNADGGLCYSSLILSHSVLYGAASIGETNGLGGLFKINADGTGFTTFFVFPTSVNGVQMGGSPMGGLLLLGNVLYGTAQNGGSNKSGSVFSINTDGSGYKVLHTFARSPSNLTNADGALPQSTLTSSGNVLYGTTYKGGIYGYGTVFSINTDGSNFTNLYIFDSTNGADVRGSVVVAAGRVYGTTADGGNNSLGVIFAMDTNGSNFSIYHHFSGLGAPFHTNPDGATPYAGLTLVGDTLYGTASQGGTIGDGYGTVFAINTNGMAFQTLHSFDLTHGASPRSPLFFTNGLLYGTTYGTLSGTCYGNVFSLDTSGAGFTDYFDFPAYPLANGTNATGASPFAGVVVDDGGSIFGATYMAGTGGTGSIYALPSTNYPPPVLTILPSVTAGYLVVSWESPNYYLQSAAAPNGPFTTIPGATSPYMFQPTDAEEFFRLKLKSAP